MRPGSRQIATPYANPNLEKATFYFARSPRYMCQQRKKLLVLPKPLPTCVASAKADRNMDSRLPPDRRAAIPSTQTLPSGKGNVLHMPITREAYCRTKASTYVCGFRESPPQNGISVAARPTGGHPPYANLNFDTLSFLLCRIPFGHRPITMQA